METFRYRTLPSHRESESYEYVDERSGKMGTWTAYWDEVDAHEAVADRETLIRMIQRGEVMPTDIVFSHGQWRSFNEAPEFFEACDGVFNDRALELNVRDAVLKLKIVAIFVALILLPLLAVDLIPERKHVAEHHAVISKTHDRLVP